MSSCTGKCTSPGLQSGPFPQARQALHAYAPELSRARPDHILEGLLEIVGTLLLGLMRGCKWEPVQSSPAIRPHMVSRGPKVGAVNGAVLREREALEGGSKGREGRGAKRLPCEPGPHIQDARARTRIHPHTLTHSATHTRRQRD